jgi:ribosomal protein S18 acetylase RimI-like enzyme
MSVDRSQRILIEPATEADRKAIVDGIADLQDVERDISDTRRPGKDIAEQYVARLEASIDQKRGTILVARADGNVAGFIACWIEQEDNVAETPESTTYGYISDAWVAADMRGRGVFFLLNEHAEKHLARFPEVSIVRINVLAKNLAALRAYEKADYEPYEMTLQKRLKPRSNGLVAATC